MFSKLKERISRLKEKKFEKEDKKAILVAFLSIFLILLSFHCKYLNNQDYHF